MRWTAVALLAMAALVAAPSASAYTEAEAPALDARVLAVWHEPATVQAGQQWRAYLRLAPDAEVGAVGFQACIVPGACIMPPQPAVSLGNGTWMMDSNWSARPLGTAYPWPAGHLGVAWYLAANETALDYSRGQAFPQGREPGDPACVDAAACIHTHYVTFVAQAVPAQDAPAPGLLLLAVALLVAAALRRHD